MMPSPELVAAVEGMRRFGSYGMPLIKAIEAYFREGAKDISAWDEIHARVLAECGTFQRFSPDTDRASGVPLVDVARPNPHEFWIGGVQYHRPDLESLHQAAQVTTAKTWLKHDTRYTTPRKKKKNEH